eukprot:2008301-Rhodomonas_salina.1
MPPGLAQRGLSPGARGSLIRGGVKRIYETCRTGVLWVKWKTRLGHTSLGCGARKARGVSIAHRRHSFIIARARKHFCCASVLQAPLEIG